jgi:PST family polysaccharide transporter
MPSERNILKSGIWSYVENGSAQVFSLITFLFIARLVGPEEFGIVAIASAWSALFMSLTEAGIGDAVIQKNDRDQCYVSTAFWLNLCLALLGTAIVLPITCTVPLSDNPKIGQYLAVLAIGIPISALGNIPTSLLRADLNNKVLARRGIASDLVGCCMGIVAAQLGMGGWAIIIQSLVSNTIKTVMVWKCSGWLPTWQFKKNDAKQIFQFGYKALATGILSSISARTDRFVLGFFFTAKEVGIYSIASEGINRISSLFIMGLAQVMFPHYASLQNNIKNLTDSFYKSLSNCCYIGAVAFGGLYIVAPYLATGILGSKWENSIPILQILSLLGVLQCTFVVPMTLYKSVGRPGIGVIHGLLQLIPNVILVTLFHSQGLIAVAIALVCRPVLTFFIHSYTTSLILPDTKKIFFNSVIPGLFLFFGVIILDMIAQKFFSISYIATILGIVVLVGALVLKFKSLSLSLRS